MNFGPLLAMMLSIVLMKMSDGWVSILWAVNGTVFLVSAVLEILKGFRE